MTKPLSKKRFRFWPVSLLGLIGLLIISMPVALAHPLDQYLLASYITVAPEQIIVEIDMTPGVLVAPGLLPQLDTDGDQQFSEAESRAYAALVLKNIELKVDGQGQQLTLTKIDMPPYLNVQTGYGTMRLFAKADLPKETSGVHQLYYKNNYQPTNPAYQVNAFVDDNIPVTLGTQNRDDSQQSMTMAYTITAASTLTTSAPATVAASNPAVNSGTTAANQLAPANSAQLQQVFDFLYQPTLSPWLLVVALGLALLLGGLHALTPGHGKTMVAAYLVGSRGTAKHAIALGGIVAFTHTISVIGLGLLALLASQFIVPTILVPILESIAGIVVLSLGLRLVWTRWHFLRAHGSASSHHSHDHLHPHDHSHNHDHHHSHDHSHDHDHHHGDAHSHAVPEKLTPSTLLAMGISGGIIPCPEALGILVVAIGLNRIGLGLSLITAFSIGVAIVLITIGLLLVRARTLLERLSTGGRSWQRWLPLVSAAIVTIIGVVMVCNGLWKYPLVLSLLLLAIVLVSGVIIARLRLTRRGQAVLNDSPFQQS